MAGPVTISSSEQEGFTHIEARCGCGQIICLPFRLLKLEGRAKDDTPIADIAERLRCSRCKQKPATWRLWHQYIDGSGQGIADTYGKV